MSDTAPTILIAVLALLFGFGIGFEAGTIRAGKECDRLGGFFVDQTVYECKQKGQP